MRLTVLQYYSLPAIAWSEAATIYTYWHSRTLAKIVEIRRRTHSRALVVGETAQHSTTSTQSSLGTWRRRVSAGWRGVAPLLALPQQPGQATWSRIQSSPGGGGTGGSGGHGRPERGRAPARCRGGRRRSHHDSSGSRDDPPPLARPSTGLSSTKALLTYCAPAMVSSRVSLFNVHVLQPELHRDDSTIILANRPRSDFIHQSVLVLLTYNNLHIFT